MELHRELIGLLRSGYGRFRARRFTEAAALGAAVLFPALLLALAAGLVLGKTPAGAWLVPAIVIAGGGAALVRALRFGVRGHVGFGAFLLEVERRAKLERNDLVNALQLGRKVPEMDDPLARDVAGEVLRRGIAKARTVPFAALARTRSLRAPLGQAGGALALACVLALLMPEVLRRTAGQVLHPGRVPETAGLQILVEPGDCTAERGGSVAVRARLVGLSGDPTLFHRTGGGAWQRIEMSAANGAFEATLNDLQAETEYAVAVRRDRSRNYRIALEEPLRATGYEKRLSFPSYTGLAPEKELSPHGSIAALKGSDVELVVSTSRSDASGRLVFESGRTIDLVPGAAGLTTSWNLREPDAYQVVLASRGNHASPWRSERFTVDPIPDRMPNIYLLAPGEQVDLPPEMRVVLEVDCADDFGITRLDLLWKRNDGPESRVQLARWQKETEGRVSYPWNLEEIAETPGDRIVYRLALTDNDTVSGPKTAYSPEFLIRFPTLDQMYAQQEEDRQEGIEQIRDSLSRQVELREQLEKISQEMRRDRGSADWEQKQEMQQFVERQQEVLQKMEQLSEQLDRQIERMQRGELFSPEILQKIAQIQEMVRQIQNPEFQKMLERMREAMQSLDPKQVQKAIEQMKLTQKELEQGLDRTLRMLERLLAEENLDEMIQRAERLMEQQNEINDKLGQSPDGSRPDSTSSLSEQQAKELQEKQDAARRELEELRKQLEELKNKAGENHPQMAEKMEGEQGESGEQSLEKADSEMQQSQQSMSQRNRKGGRKSGRKASANLKSFVQQMKELQSEISRDMNAEMSRKLLGLAGNLVDLSQNQEETLDRASQANTRDLAVEQSHIERATGNVVDQIYELARENPFITPAQARALGEVMGSLSSATDAFETGQRGQGSTMGRRAETGMDQVVASLLESNQNMCNSSSASAACNKPNPSSAMSGICQQQQGLNQDSQSAHSQMQGGQRLQQQGGSGQLEQLAARQEQIRQGLKEVAGSIGDQGNVLGRLDEMGKEMEEIAREMRESNFDERVLQRQERILSRLLTAERSLRRQDFEEERRSRTGVDPADLSSPPPLEPSLSEREQIRRGILKGSQDQIPGDFRRIVDEYFRALTQESK
jgi:hypothetical protein